MATEKSRMRPLTSCSYRSSRGIADCSTLATLNNIKDVQNSSLVTNSDIKGTINKSSIHTNNQLITTDIPCILPEAAATRERIHKDLDALHDKISRLENKLKSNSNNNDSTNCKIAVAHPSILKTSKLNTSQQILPAFSSSRGILKQKSGLEGELSELYEQNNNSRLYQTEERQLTMGAMTTRAVSTDKSRLEKPPHCPSARNSYGSMRSSVSKTVQNVKDENKENVSTNVQSQNEGLNEIVIQAKHEVLMQLTSGLEEERRKNEDNRKEIEMWKRRSMALEMKYNSLKQDYDELMANYTNSELLRKQQKQLISDFQQSKNHHEEIRKSSKSSTKPKVKETRPRLKAKY